VGKAEDVVKVGDEIDVKILKVNKEHKRVSLSLKQTTTNPWESAAEKYGEGTRLTGRVVRLANFGAFVELEPGVDGLLPVSEMSWTRRVRHPSEIVKEGDVVEVSVLGFDEDKKRISLSLKALREDPWEQAAQKYAAGSTATGKVVRVVDFGAFVQLEDGVDGLVHISELADERVRSAADKVKPGDEVEVRVLGVNLEARKISLSMRRPPAEPTPEEVAKIQAERAAAAKKRASRPKRGGITFGWDEGLGALDPSKFTK
jgi:small subunit ribosomal protein S1